jgi:replicative DNA helicase
LRTRYGFALMMEHHAPQSIGGAREIRPYGSSYWLRWPEIGIALSRKDGRDDVLSVSRWRGDRFPSDWPVEFERGTVFPFSGRWEK